MYLRQWQYEDYFHGTQVITVPLERTQEEVKQEVNRMRPGGNWNPDSLKRLGKVKQKKRAR